MLGRADLGTDDRQCVQVAVNGHRLLPQCMKVGIRRGKIVLGPCDDDRAQRITL